MTRLLTPFFACFALPALAEVPVVVADIGPVHSMVARVMDGVGVPSLLLPTSVSPHGHAMRPSEAEMLTQADVVIWVGADLAPWMAQAIGSLAQNAVAVELLEEGGIAPLPAAPDVMVEEAHHEGEEDNHHDGHDGHGDHEEHESDKGHEGHDDHADAAAHDHGHDHGGIDPHGWLDPATGKLWLRHIADVLSEVDPENAIIYGANAEAGQAELDGLILELRAQLAPVAGRGFITFHDAYGRFEARFGMPSLGAISISDAVPPSARQVSVLRDMVVASKAECVFSEPQFAPDLVTTLTEGTGARAGVLDPLGATLQPGIELYPTLLRNISASLKDCLTP